jgi:hypothetical protein
MPTQAIVYINGVKKKDAVGNKGKENLINP